MKNNVWYDSGIFENIYSHIVSVSVYDDYDMKRNGE